jgi:hypothetical protein
MAEQPTFNQQADGAAADLKAKMGLPSKSVEVDSNGNPAPPPPPPGSYAAQIREQRKEAEQTVAVNEALTQVSNDADPVGSAPAEEERFNASENAERRIRELVGKLKEAHREVDHLRSRVTATDQEVASNRVRNEEQISEMQEDPSPDLQSALRRQREEFEARLRPLAEKAKLDDLERLHRKYSGYDPAVHPDLIDMYRQQNPASTIEQAFRAVATDEELTRGSVKPAAVPPTVAPSGNTQPRSIPEPEPDPEEQAASELQQLMEQARSLSNSRDPEAQRVRDRLFREMIARKTGL